MKQYYSQNLPISLIITLKIIIIHPLNGDFKSKFEDTSNNFSNS